MKENRNTSDEHDNQGPGGDSDETSKEQLSDIEENEAEVDGGSSTSDPGPSPDGAFD